MIKIDFVGACDTVTGSMHLITVNDKKILLDCGLYQGHRKDTETRNRNFPFDPKEISCLVVSHAHIDHSGNIPNLVKNGFQGNIYSTRGTAMLLEPMLLDSAKIQMHDVEWLNRKKRKRGEVPLEALYTDEDARKAFGQFRPKAYHEEFTVCSGVGVIFLDAGHILGSALTILKIDDGEKKVSLGFTGDLGRKFLPIIRDPEQIKNVDYLLMEATYGDRIHSDVSQSYKDLSEIINTTYKRGGKVVIPSFAVERAQELLYIIHELKDTKQIPYDIPVYLDTPLGVKVTDVFTECLWLYDEETNRKFLKRGDNPFEFHGLRYIQSVEESKALNKSTEPSVIISSSGMVEFGRIRHHIKNTIEDKKNTIAIVGYQAQHTTGRRLVRGEKKIKILDDILSVNAEVRVLNSLSAHADQNGLVDFAKNAGKFRKMFLVHGEESAKAEFAKKLEGVVSGEVINPECNSSFILD